ncbi:MAG: hypothetical protein EOP49_25035, partial [Sphingobacteriales bacterium]
IHIDDLIRQKLGGSEEREPSGAWLQMRDLLDQKMPVTAARGAYNWKRMLGLVSGLAFIATLTVGGYFVVSSTGFRNNTGLENATTGRNGKGFGKGQHTSNGIARNGENRTVLTNDARESVQSGIRTGTAKGGSSLTTDISVEKSGSNTSDISANRLPAKNNTPASGNIGSTNEPHNTGLVPGSRALKKTPADHTNKLASKGIAKGSLTDLILAGNDSQERIDQGMTALSTGTISGNARMKENLKTAGNTNIANSGNRETKRETTPSFVKNEDKKDTFRQMRIVQRYVINPLNRTRKTYLDTISYGKVALSRRGNAISSLTDAGAFAGVTALASPAAAAADQALAKAGLAADMVPLASYKIKSRKTNAWDAQRFNEVMREVKFNLSQMKFYPGVMFGYNNYMLDNAALHGFHIGVTGQLTFDEQWSMMSELKYFHRANSSYSLQDNYTKILSPSLHSKVEHFFKLSSLQSIEMPLAIRYTASRLNLFGGANLAYTFRINPEEINHEFAPEQTHAGILVNAPTITAMDFGNRFSIGGLLGLSYSMTPALQMDLRATKSFWDNAKGNGAEKVSRQLFRAPSVQLSIGYRFSQKTRFPKAK